MHGSTTVMIIDDDADIRSSVAHALEREGYRVPVASNGREALLVLSEERERPDLILLDAMMPEMDGWTFRAAQRKRPELASIPVVVFTAYRLERDAAEQLHAAAFIDKPVQLDALLGTIERVLGREDQAGRD
jgi:two-component system response regulator MprA